VLSIPTLIHVLLMMGIVLFVAVGIMVGNSSSA
jgi:hypothetical protein